MSGGREGGARDRESALGHTGLTALSVVGEENGIRGREAVRLLDLDARLFRQSGDVIQSCAGSARSTSGLATGFARVPLSSLEGWHPETPRGCRFELERHDIVVPDVLQRGHGARPVNLTLSGGRPHVGRAIVVRNHSARVDEPSGKRRHVLHHPWGDVWLGSRLAPRAGQWTSSISRSRPSVFAALTLNGCISRLYLSSNDSTYWAHCRIEST